MFSFLKRRPRATSIRPPGAASPAAPPAKAVTQSNESLWPRRLDEFIGQDRLRENLQVAIAAAKQRRESLEHVLLLGPPGVGKTTLAHVIANEVGVPLREVSAASVERESDFIGIVTNLAAGEVLLVDDIDRISTAIEVLLAQAMANFEVDVVIGHGPAARTVTMRVERFTLIGTSSRPERIRPSLKARFAIIGRLELYGVSDLDLFVQRIAHALFAQIDGDAVIELAENAHGTPEAVDRLVRRARDFADVRGNGTITLDAARAAVACQDNGALDNSGTRREPIPRDVQMFVWQRDGGACVRCGTRELLEFDHIVPLAKGGSNTARNIQLLCATCNRDKGSNF